MKVKYQNRELFESKTFLAIGLGETNITIGNEPESLNFILDFIQEDSKEQKLEILPVDNRTLKFKLTNWNNVLGTSLLEPIEVGRINRRKFFILFSVKKAGNQGQVREVTFSAYLGEEIQDGAN